MRCIRSNRYGTAWVLGGKEMKHKKNIGLVTSIVILIVGIVLSIVLTKAIVNADIPDWLKLWLLM